MGRTEVGIHDGFSEGRRVFMNRCHQCHPGGEGGLGPAINNKPLPGFLIHFQIRHGLGAMPSFPPDKISEEEIHSVIAYLNSVRAHH
jgi:mono/diheme cytochrome c family protein